MSVAVLWDRTSASDLHHRVMLPGRDPCITLCWPLTSSSGFNYSQCNRQHTGRNLCSNISKTWLFLCVCWWVHGGGKGTTAPTNAIGRIFIFRSIRFQAEILWCDLKHRHQLTWFSRVTIAAVFCQRWQTGLEQSENQSRESAWLKEVSHVAGWSLWLFDGQRNGEWDLNWLKNMKQWTFLQVHLSDHRWARAVMDWTRWHVAAR